MFLFWAASPLFSKVCDKETEFCEKGNIRLSLDMGQGYNSKIMQQDIFNNQISIDRGDAGTFIGKLLSLNFNIFPFAILSAQNMTADWQDTYLRPLGIHAAIGYGESKSVIFSSTAECEKYSDSACQSRWPEGFISGRFMSRIGLRYDITLFHPTKEQFLNIVPGAGFWYENAALTSKSLPLFQGTNINTGNLKTYSPYASLTLDWYFYFGEMANLNLSFGVIWVNRTADFGAGGMEVVQNQFFFPLSIGMGFR